jgi:PAS domain S-box-containing protein
LQALVHGLQAKNQSLSQERSKLESILESVSDGVIAINSSQQIISINAQAAKLVDSSPDVLVGKDLLLTFPLRHDDQPLGLSIDNPKVTYYRNVLLPSKDKLLYLDIAVASIKQQANGVAAIITTHDLTQSRELEAMKLDFVAMAAHELRTPLTVVRGYLNLINNDPEIVKMNVMNLEYLQRAISGVAQLAGLINNILNVSRIERGTLGISILKVDIAKTVYEIVTQQMVSAHLKKQQMKYTGPNEGLFVAADETAIAEVVNNLVVNAIKYTQEGGDINIKLEKRGLNARLEVADNGAGISEDVQNHLFTKFYRAESSLTSGNRGTGLGLFISKSIIELHRGEIGVISKPNQGAAFYFTLPLFENSKHAPGAKTAERKPQ